MVVQPQEYTKKALNCTLERYEFYACELYVNKTKINKMIKL